MYLFKGLFGEPEIIEMTESFWYALDGVLDDKVALRVKEFWAQADTLQPSPVYNALMNSVRISKECIGDSVRRHTFHLEVIEKQIVSRISNIFMTNILYTTENREELENDIAWLLENRSFWRTTIESRESKKYQAFLKEVEKLHYVVIARGIRGDWDKLGIKPNRNLLETLYDNKDAFYKANEKRRSTRMDLVFKKSTELEYMLHGLRFDREFSKENNSGFYYRRAF